jgi:uncharacterized protein
MLSYNVADLLRSAPGTAQRLPIAATGLPIADDIELAQPLEGEIRLQNSGRSIIVSGHLRTAIAESCSRCLRPAVAPITIDIVEEVLPSVDLDSGAAMDTSEEPELMRLDDHHELDLLPIVREAISLAEPIAPLCRPDCPGLCAVCGADLAGQRGHAHDEEIDPRMASLAGIRERLL